MTLTARALHYVFKIGDRKASYDFYTNILKMKVLRHEEFVEGCKATCNGPYDGQWSKTMIGYGPEDSHFVLELTYNYNIGKYRLGNDFRAILIDSDEIYAELDKQGTARKTDCGRLAITDPDGHCFKIGRGSANSKISCVVVNVADLEKSLAYWAKLLEMPIVEKLDYHAILSYGEGQCKWKLCQLDKGKQLDRGSAFGRIAFAYPGNKLSDLQDKVKEEKGKILNELITLETPGKADVQVVILADPNDHEICFVGTEGFAELSKVDPAADDAIKKAIQQDDSEQWFKDFKNGKKAEA